MTSSSLDKVKSKGLAAGVVVTVLEGQIQPKTREIKRK